MDNKQLLQLKLVPYLIIFFIMFLTPIHSNHLLTLCQTNTGTSNTAIKPNLKSLLESLTSLTPQSNGFFNTSVGDDSDKVNGQALCRGDAKVNACRECLTSASQEIRRSCGTPEAIIWYEHCQIHYASREFFGMMEYAGKVPDERYYTRRNVSRDEQFGKIFPRLIEKILKDDRLGDPKIMFATADVSYSKEEKIYGLAQCTRDIDEINCKTCLRSAWGDLMERSSSKEGGIMLSGSCTVRFEVFSFYNTSSLIEKSGNKSKKWKVVVIAFACASALAILICSLFAYLLCNRGSRKDERVLLHSSPSPRAKIITSNNVELVNTEELPLMDLATINAATNGFSNLNKLGQGGFGSVFKGVLPDGKAVAVKRLSRMSWQGLDEFKNELILIAKLQHRNLVRLVGCAMEDEEKLLIYEFMANKSLDSFIFDSAKRSLLDWKIRYDIICGIARGLLYLHEDSRLKVIHRDLKPSNVLLDDDMVAKISDFGLARIFSEGQNAASTRKVVGTYGYMAPEYAMDGHFSVKSDVFSFGVILLEIISGRKNSSLVNSQTLIRYAWHLYREGKELEFLDPSMRDESGSIGDVIRCIHIGLLCVQADPNDRPTMSSVVVLLESGLVSLPQPSQPAFCVPKITLINQSSLINNSLSGLTAFSSISSTSCP